MPVKGKSLFAPRQEQDYFPFVIFHLPLEQALYSLSLYRVRVRA